LPQKQKDKFDSDHSPLKKEASGQRGAPAGVSVKKLRLYPPFVYHINVTLTFFGLVLGYDSAG